MKNSLIKYLFYGILGGILIFLLDLYDIYYLCPLWVYFILFLVIPFIPMVLRRLKKTSQRSFGTLFKIGMIVSMTSILIFSIIGQIYPNYLVTSEEKTRLVDEKVNRMIMDFDGSNGNKIDIFAMQHSASSFFDFSLKQSLIRFLIMIPFYIISNTLFALILKTDEDSLPLAVEDSFLNVKT